MTPEESDMIRGLLQISRGSPGYGKSTIYSIAIDDGILSLGLIAEDGRVSLNIEFSKFVMMDETTFAQSPYRFGELLGAHLDEEIDTGLVSERAGETVFLDNS